MEGLRRERGGTVAAAAPSYLTRKFSQLQLSSKDTWDGLLLAFTRQEGINRAAAASAKSTYDRLNNKFNNSVESILDAERQRVGEHAKTLSEFSRKQDILRRWKSRHFDRKMKDLEAEKKISFDEIAAVRNTYEEMMKLKAPVDYWTDKAKTHRTESTRYRQLLLDYGWKVASGVLGGLLLLSIASFLFAQADKPATAYLLLVTIGVVITTMAFWAARIVVRLYMSEHHLAINADERATMAMTYLALIERGAVEEKDRALILAPLFRPSSDGIVKDDAAPDLSPASLLSKMLSK